MSLYVVDMCYTPENKSSWGGPAKLKLKHVDISPVILYTCELRDVLRCFSFLLLLYKR